MSKSEEKIDLSKSAMGAKVTKVRYPKVSKEDQALIKSQVMDQEDGFESMYYGSTNPSGEALRPPFDPCLLKALCQNNNILGTLVTAMEVNIDGTGYVIESKDEAANKVDDENTKSSPVEGFFSEVAPGVSFLSHRRKIRRDMEEVGYAFQEIVRNPTGQIVFINYVPAHTVRLMRLDEAVPVVKMVTRNGAQTQVRTLVRERRFVQIVGQKKIYFKAYGSSRDLDYLTGKWVDNGSLPYDQRASELQMFIVNEDVRTSYGVPRWISQIPSVLGSRKAEELNLQFFDAGGLPPAIIFLQGGALTKEVRAQLENYMSGRGAKKVRGAIVEVLSNSGDLSGSGSAVKVSVERFGSREDSMFENYDDKCEIRVRSSFRLPPIFVGRTDSYSYATAFASYAVGEAQVFAIERKEFDDIITNTIVKELDDSLRLRSNPLNVKDAVNQLKAVELATGSGAIDNGTLVDTLNEVTNLRMKAHADSIDMPTSSSGNTGLAQDMAANAAEAVASAPNPPVAPGKKPIAKSDPITMIKLASEFASWITGDREFTPEQVKAMVAVVEKLSPNERKKFDGYVTLKVLGSAVDNDLEGALELCGCASHIVAKDGG